jgi:uncharacterized protein
LQAFRDFFVVLFSILLEATPFLLLGVFVSAALSVYVSDAFLIRWFPKGKITALLFALVLGFLFPVCECGNVPVARRLIAKGAPHGAAVTFLLAAPVLNPIVVIVTLAAFPGQPQILWLRLGFTVIISLAVGGFFSMARASDVVNPAVFGESSLHDCDVDHGHQTGEEVMGLEGGYHGVYEHTCRECYEYYENLPTKQRFNEFLFLLRDEFIEMLWLLVLGAMVASAIRTLAPQGFVNKLGASPVLSVLAMMLLAFMISLCSNVDAFFAAAFASSFLPGSIIAFLVFGPMIDIKALVMMTTTFKLKAIFWMTLLVALYTFLLAMLTTYVIL